MLYHIIQSAPARMPSRVKVRDKYIFSISRHVNNIMLEVPVSWCRNIETLKERGEQFAKQPITALIGIYFIVF